MQKELFFEFENSQYGDGVMLERYKGTYSIVAAKKTQSDKIYMQWVYLPKKGKNAGPSDKILPWKIKLGDNREEAISTLKWLIQNIGEDDSTPF